MKLGTETGSLINHFMGGSNVSPQIGMGATLLSWTDRDPATVIAYDMVKQIVTVQEDSYKRIDSNGMSEAQEYEYTPNPKGSIHNFRWGKKGWERVTYNPETNRWKKSHSGGLHTGTRERFYDFSF